jgi:hypothetical protein
VRELTNLHARRCALVKEAAAICPPNFTEARVGACASQIKIAEGLIVDAVSKHCDAMQRALARFLEARSERLRDLQRALVDGIVCSADEVRIVIETKCTPILSQISGALSEALSTLQQWLSSKVRTYFYVGLSY